MAASAGDSSVASLLSLIQSGLPEIKTEWPEHLHVFFRHRESLCQIDGVVLIKNRPLIPPSLRAEVLDLLHQGHQGVTSMALHAEQTIYWPNYKEDIIHRRLSCSGCTSAAPSQPSAPPTPLPIPEYPFQMISTDYFSYRGRSYFVIIDRYSKWIYVYTAKN